MRTPERGRAASLATPGQFPHAIKQRFQAFFNLVSIVDMMILVAIATLIFVAARPAIIKACQPRGSTRPAHESLERARK